MTVARRQFRLGDICEIFDGPHATPRKTPDGPIFLGISCLERGRLNLNEAEHLSEEDFKKWTRRVTPQEGDVVFSYETRLGEVAIIPKGLRCCLGRRMGLLRANRDLVDPSFLLYLYLAPQFQEQIRQRTVHGSTVDRIPLIDMPNWLVEIPDLPTQRRIALAASLIDEKIELNRKTIETLELLARSLFKSWFIDFEPVHSKKQGKAPKGMDDSIASLFPDRFIKTELGEIPYGWTVGTVLDFADLISGGTPKTSHPEYWDGDVKWASAKDVSQAGKPFIVETERRITELGLNNSSTKIVPKFATAVVARGATTGRFTMFGTDMAMNQTCYALKSKNEMPFFLNSLLAFEIPKLVSAAHGSVFDTITTDTFRLSKMVSPEIKVIQAYERIASNFFEMILNNLHETNHLAQMRDLLLPRLLDGEISIGEAAL